MSAEGFRNRDTWWTVCFHSSLQQLHRKVKWRVNDFPFWTAAVIQITVWTTILKKMLFQAGQSIPFHFITSTSPSSVQLFFHPSTLAFICTVKSGHSLNRSSLKRWWPSWPAERRDGELVTVQEWWLGHKLSQFVFSWIDFFISILDAVHKKSESLLNTFLFMETNGAAKCQFVNCNSRSITFILEEWIKIGLIVTRKEFLINSKKCF